MQPSNMQSSMLMAALGLGGALLIAGAVLVGAGAAVALASWIPQIPMAAWLMICGAVLTPLGLTLIERGSAKTVEKVEAELSVPKVFANFPWAWAAAGLSAACVGFWFARWRASSTPAEPANPTPTEPPKSPPPRARMTLSEVFEPLVVQAAASAAAAGMTALGVPSLQQMASSLFAANTPKPESTNANPARQHAGVNGSGR